MKVRLHKYLADAGVASRRGAEALMRAGRVTVNGTPVCAPGSCIDPEQDVVRCDDQPIRLRKKLHVAINKPVGYVCTREAQGQQRRVGDLLPREWSFLYPVGRLDRDTEGLLFLTNDGDFCLHLTHPRYGVCKTYLAVVEGRVEPAALARMQAGLVHEGERLQARRARLISSNATRSVVELELSEGKHHEVRRLFAAQGLTVIELRRTQIGTVRLAELPLGKYRVLTASEVRSLKALSADTRQPSPSPTAAARAPRGSRRPRAGGGGRPPRTGGWR